MDENNTLYLTGRNQWRTWLGKNQSKRKEIWLVYFKKHTKKPRIPYDDAVEEAICFGWIDSIVKRIDDERFMQKFTPRKNVDLWSDENKKRAKKMIEQGKMTPAGLKKIKDLKSLDNIQKGKINKPGRIIIPSELREVLLNNSKAKEFFDSLAFSYKKMYCGWVGSAKREETRKKRAQEAITLLNQEIKSLLK